MDKHEQPKDPAESTPPIGTILAFAGEENILPENWKLCDGRLLDPDLPENHLVWDKIGYAWGREGNLFRLPDLRGYFLRGVNSLSQNDGEADDRFSLHPNGNQGNKVGSFQTDAMQCHAHEVRVIRENICGSNRTRDVDDDDKKWNADPDLGRIAVEIGDPKESPRGGGPPRVGKQTRPMNAYVNWIIRVK